MNAFKAVLLIPMTVAAVFCAQLHAQSRVEADQIRDLELVQSDVNADTTEGEVRKVDREAKRITLRHGEIRNLEMPAMTMVFQVTDAALLDQLKPGDKVRFKAEKIGGELTVTAIKPAK